MLARCGRAWAAFDASLRDAVRRAPTNPARQRPCQQIATMLQSALKRSVHRGRVRACARLVHSYWLAILPHQRARSILVVEATALPHALDASQARLRLASRTYSIHSSVLAPTAAGPRLGAGRVRQALH